MARGAACRVRIPDRQACNRSAPIRQASIPVNRQQSCVTVHAVQQKTLHPAPANETHNANRRARELASLYVIDATHSAALYEAIAVLDHPFSPCRHGQRSARHTRFQINLILADSLRTFNDKLFSANIISRPTSAYIMSGNTDFFNIDSMFSEEELLVRDTVRSFVAREILPIIEQANREQQFPMHLAQRMAELGIFGATLPEEYGCAAASNVIYGLMMQELERGDSGIRSFASVQSSLVMYPIFRYGTEEQKKRWLPLLASATAIGCFGLTEPDHGSDPGGMITRAEKTADGYVLNGAKMWITNGSIADVAVVWAKLDGRIHGFLVERDTAGFTAPEMHGKHSLKASVTSELVFQDCHIPDQALLPEAKGLKAPLSCLTQARFGIAWGAMGAAEACYTAALDYAGTRRQFGKPIAAFQLVQQKLVAMINEITKGRLLALRLGRMKDEGSMTFGHVSMTKRNNVHAALEIARMARDILGANGILDEYPVMRHMNNLESVYTYEGTHDIHTLIIGHEITGIAAYS
jgi:glutaryl-CoA dehydrogenase